MISRQPRILALAAFLSLSFSVGATTPPAQNVTAPTVDGQVVVATWTGSTPPGASGGGNTCVDGVGTDTHTINLTVPTGAYDDVKITADFHIEWDDASSDLVLTVETAGVVVGDSDGGTPEENVSTNNPASGAFKAIACPFAAALPTTIRGRLTLTATAKVSTNPDLDGDGVLNEIDVCPGTPSGATVDADGCTVATASGLPPRFQIHVAPPGMGDDSGEPSIGFNKNTGRTMYISYVNALRQTYHESVVPQVLPASCPALWEEKSGLLTTVNSLDPILFTDEATGRIFNSQLSGSNSLFEFSDDDGENWTVAQQGPPNGGADHQTVASGRYPASFTPPTALWPSSGPKRAVYYCSQSVATAFCSRSDDGGQVFGPGFTFKNADCAAGALHGHVKVAPDGTVYVPDSSQCVLPVGGTADTVIAFRSDNAGQTWSVKSVPSSVGGAASDPSIGIATDGTLYMCYEDSNSHVRMAVSKDKGNTWINDRELGASLGIIQTRFPQAVAGDPDRAACAFLGTTTEGNGESLSFAGVWHGYMATTYDGGLSYHLANVTPLDPVQGHGGICGSGTCRNLLDFNDLQIDDKGRLIFAYADGCIGACVKDPSANGFAAKGSIVRQSGGRTLLATFDNNPTRFNNPTTITPAPACARQDLSVRTETYSNVVWSTPDTGGARISNYEVHRATSAAGPFVLLGSSGTATSFLDSTVDPLVEKYYYKVVAQNSVGKALDSNVIELVVTIIPFVDTCVAPGDIVIADPTGDVSPAPADEMDIVFVGIHEPEAYPDSFVFTLKIKNFTTGAPPSGGFYTVMFPAIGNKYIAMRAETTPPRFEYGTFVVDTTTSFTAGGNLNPASKFTANGTITLIVPRSYLGNPAVGGVIPGFEARARVGANTTSRDSTATADYTVRGSAICITGVTLADLKATPVQGNSPLKVSFKISGTQSKNKSLDTYTINFGEAGSSATTGSFNGQSSVQLTHSYTKAGVYRASLSISDVDGTASVNPAEQTITVTGGSSGTAEFSNNKLGGSLPPALLLVLAAAGVLGRRRRIALPV